MLYVTGPNQVFALDALNGNPLYLPPPGFVEVTKENQDTKLSPHFALKQFLCKEDTSKQFPKYVARYKDSACIKGVRQVLHNDDVKAGYCLQDSFIKGVRLAWSSFSEFL